MASLEVELMETVTSQPPLQFFLAANPMASLEVELMETR